MARRRRDGATDATAKRSSIGQDRGVTLIELMLVVAIVGLLSVIATVGYRAYVERAHRVYAMNALNLLYQRQEDFRLINNTYTDDLDALGFPDGCSEHCVYTISFAVAPDTRAYTARAEPTPDGGHNGVNQTSDDRCQWFTIDSRGVRDAGPADACWSGR
jgi:type IV pilus assembly protein PilE